MIPVRKPDYYVNVLGRAVPKKRPRVTRKGTFMPQDYVNYKSWVSLCASRVVKKPTKKRVAISIHFQFEDRRWGDIDNLAGSILDAFNKVVYNDDRQVVALQASKSIDKIEGGFLPAGAQISIWILQEDEDV